MCIRDRNNIDSDKVSNLKELSGALRGMNKVELNFGTVGVVTPALTSENDNMNGQTVFNNIVSSPISQTNNTVRQSYRATGARAVPTHIHNNTMK